MKGRTRSPERINMISTTHGGFHGVQEAWAGALARLQSEGADTLGVEDSHSVGSNFGTRERSTREIIAASFSILNPRRRLFSSDARPIDLGYTIANVLWTLSGSKNLEMIFFYNPLGKNFSDDGVTLFGAPGYRIFQSQVGDQFELAAEKIGRDASTRRAVIHVSSPLDLREETRDCSCLLSLQFLLRDQTLDCIAHMRSQSALMVLPYDLFLLTMLHEAMAVRLGVELGIYHHFCGSLHYYNDEKSVVDLVLREHLSPPPEMPPMTSLSPKLKQLLVVAEMRARQMIEREPLRALATTYEGLDPYWADLIRVMSAGALQRRGRQLSDVDLALLPSIFRSSLVARNKVSR
jgi:thymidylate synthase